MPIELEVQDKIWRNELYINEMSKKRSRFV